jgi:hypothetical protein
MRFMIQGNESGSVQVSADISNTDVPDVYDSHSWLVDISLDDSEFSFPPEMDQVGSIILKNEIDKMTKTDGTFIIA